MKKLVIGILFFFQMPLLAHSQGTQVRDDRRIAIDSLEKLLIKLDKEAGGKPDTAKIPVLERLWAYYADIDYDKAALYAQKEIDLSEEAEYPKGIAEGNLRLAVISDLKGDYTEALYYNQKALAIQEEINDGVGMSASYGNIAVSYSKQGNYPEALRNAISSLKISEELKDVESMAYAYNSIGIIYKLQNDYDNALKNFFAELKTFEDLKHNEGIAAVCNNIGSVYMKLGRYDDAMQYITRSLKVAEESGDQPVVASGYHDIATVYFEKREYAAAEENFLKALSIRTQLNDQFGLSATYIYLGNVFQMQGDYVKAELNVKQGLDIAQKIGDLERMKDAYKSLAGIYNATKNYQLAYQNSILYKQINDSLFNTERQKKLTELQMSYEQSKKDALAAEEIKNQKRVRNYVFLGMTVIVVFLVIVLIQRNKISRVKNQQALEQERTRISRDLHDDLGSGLTGILMMSDQIQSTDDRQLIGNNVERIRNSSRMMVDQMGEIIWAMNAKNDTLENLCGYIHSYAYDHFENQDIALQITIPESIPGKVINGMMRRNIFLAVKESFNNINKHAQATELTMNMELTDSGMKITLADNGQGFEMQQIRRFGNGLINIESRMKSIGGTYNITSKPGDGTTTVISFPLS